MGLFDYVTCHYPLPDGEDPTGIKFQTKDTAAYSMDRYEIRQDGTLWHEIYETEDRSDKTKEGLAGLVGCMTRINPRWERDMFQGELNFYSSNISGISPKGVVTKNNEPATYWDYIAVFKDGVLIDLRGAKTITDEKVIPREEF